MLALSKAAQNKFHMYLLPVKSFENLGGRVKKQHKLVKKHKLKFFKYYAYTLKNELWIRAVGIKKSNSTTRRPFFNLKR